MFDLQEREVLTSFIDNTQTDVFKYIYDGKKVLEVLKDKENDETCIRPLHLALEVMKSIKSLKKIEIDNTLIENFIRFVVKNNGKEAKIKKRFSNESMKQFELLSIRIKQDDIRTLFINVNSDSNSILVTLFMKQSLVFSNLSYGSITIDRLTEDEYSVKIEDIIRDYMFNYCREFFKEFSRGGF